MNQGKLEVVKQEMPRMNVNILGISKLKWTGMGEFNSPRCPSADEWIRKLWYIYTMEYYSTIKKDTFESVLMRWMKLEPIIQSEVNQKEKDKYCILMHIYIWNLGRWYQ